MCGDGTRGDTLPANCVHNPNAIDAAAKAAATLANAPLRKFSDAPVLVEFHDGPIVYGDSKYYGDTWNYGWIDVQVQYDPCLFAADSALLHEFFHAALFFADGDMDNAHADPRWHQLDSSYIELRTQFCQ